MVTEYLTKNKILLNVKAVDFRQVLRKMLAVSSEKKHTQIIKKIMLRESLMSTALGKSIALPRIIIKNKKKTELIIALSTKGIRLDSFDLARAKIVFLYLFSKDDNYAAILAQSLRLLNDESLRAELASCETNTEVVKAIKKWEK